MGFMIWIRMIIYFVLIQLSYETSYSCNSSASCGCSMNSATLTRIVGGEAAGLATWSWAVSISIRRTYLCGGSIISSSWILTAAHCTKDFTASDFTIYAGSNTKWTGTQSRQVVQIIMHPNYDSDTYVNDIALLRLSSPLSMSDRYVKPICLPSINLGLLSTEEWPPANTTVVAVGWGTLSSGGLLPSDLQQVTLQIISRSSSICKSTTFNSSFQLCAGVPEGGKDSCQGDSGGPLMMFNSTNQWILVGITSFGRGCAEAQYPGVYTRVAAYQDWIASITNSGNRHKLLTNELLLLFLTLALIMYYSKL